MRPQSAAMPTPGGTRRWAWSARSAVKQLLAGWLDYEAKRLAVDTLGVQVQVLHRTHDPRYMITASMPMPPAPEVQVAGGASCGSQ